MIEIATISDASEILDIYGPVIENTPISFETKVPSVTEMEKRISSIGSKYPFLTSKKEGKLLGYAYAGPHKEREAYRWSVDSTIYISRDKRGQGIGKKLYSILFEILRDLGYYNVYAGITLPNEGSVSIHESFNFRKIAEYENVGYKMGSWHNVGWWQLDLQSERRKPEEPLIFNDYLAERGLKRWE